MAKRKPKTKQADYVEPTPEQFAQGSYARQSTMAYRRVAVIVTLIETNKLSPRQFNGLARYRDIAIAEDRSPIADSVGKMIEGRHMGAGGVSPASIRTAQELSYLERELGALRDIARAVAVDDVSLSKWAMRGRSIERKVKGVVRFEPYLSDYKQAVEDIRAAGDRLAKAVKV